MYWMWHAHCTAGGCWVFILHGAGWLYSITRGTKCVVINFLLAQLKLAIWFTRTHSVCGSGPIDLLHCTVFGPSGPNIFCMWVKDSVRCSCVCKYELHIFYGYTIGLWRVLNCLYLLWNIDLSDLNLPTLERFRKCDMMLTEWLMVTPKRE